MAVIRVAFYIGKGKVGNAIIRKVTHSDTSHCEVVYGEEFGGFKCMSASIMDGEFRAKLIHLDPTKWQLFAVDTPLSEKEIMEKTEAFYRKKKGRKYDFFGALSHLDEAFGGVSGWKGKVASLLLSLFVKQDPDKDYCSEVVVEYVDEMRGELLDRLTSRLGAKTRYTPHEARDYLVKKLKAVEVTLEG